jgi:glycosyltransferase involved in cell wall biosynthesis
VRVLLDVTAVPDRPVGAGVYTVALAAGLTGRPDVDLHLTTRRGDSRWSALAPGATLHPVAPRARPARLAWEQTGAARLAARVRADLWHGPHYTMPVLGPTPAVVTVHDLTFFDHPEWHERSKVLYFRRMIRTSARRARGIVCVSRHTSRRLAEVAPPRGQVQVAHHGVDHDRFRPQPEPDDLIRLAAHGIRPPYVAFVGTLEPRKDVPALVAAFATLHRRHDALRLVLAGGDGWGAGAVRDAIGAHRVGARVLRPGYLPHDVVPALYRHAAVVAYPSREEGFGLPALEALACGAPLVTTTGSALEEVVGDAALTVTPNDVGALAQALSTALEPGTADRLRAAGPRHAATFTWQASIEAHLELYRRVATAVAA